MNNIKKKLQFKSDTFVRGNNMKNFFIIISALVLSLPSFALCPIEGGESVCSLPEFREQVSPIYNDNSGGITPNVQLQPLKREDPMKSMRDPNNELNYNSGCQFGVCLPKTNDTLIMRRNND